MSKIVVTTICVSVVFFYTVTNAEVNAKETLRLGALISQDGEFDFTGFIPAMNLALETIENDTTLPFRFSITLNDSMVSVCLHGYAAAIYTYIRNAMPRVYSPISR